MTAGLIVAFLGGPRYVAALRFVAQRYGHEEQPPLRIAHFLVVAIAVWSAVVALWSGRRRPSAAFAYASLSVTLYPWYIGWGVPYALGRPAILRALIVAFPFLDALATEPFTDGSYPALVIIGITGALILKIRSALQSRRALRDRSE